MPLVQCIKEKPHFKLTLLGNEDPWDVGSSPPLAPGSLPHMVFWNREV
jgi:hypothetical protein